MRDGEADVTVDKRAAWDVLVYDDEVGHEMDRHRGVCHLCAKEDWESATGDHRDDLIRPITYCRVCRHWFCREHRSAVFSRGIEAIKEMLQGRAEGCCGPMEDGR